MRWSLDSAPRRAVLASSEVGSGRGAVRLHLDSLLMALRCVVGFACDRDQRTRWHDGELGGDGETALTARYNDASVLLFFVNVDSNLHSCVEESSRCSPIVSSPEMKHAQGRMRLHFRISNEPMFILYDLFVIFKN
ncbi:hypothetical protein SESBI_40803 [Sesbania bispinosa]|nr:hypothetical protein SESBI_40803 [Sesbania bispinosa]